MNTSYSKIRHIQEANQRLEKRLLNEDEAQMIGMVNDELSSVGEEPVSTEDIEFALNDCPVETPPNIDSKQETVLQQAKNEIDKMTSIGQVKDTIKKIKSISKSQNEQAQALVIGALSIPIVYIHVLFGVLIVMLIIKLIKLISGGGTRTSPECRRASRRMRRYGATE
jgi:hypothetical protein